MEAKLVLDTIGCNGVGSFMLRADTVIEVVQVQGKYVHCKWDGNSFVTGVDNLNNPKQYIKKE